MRMGIRGAGLLLLLLLSAGTSMMFRVALQSDNQFDGAPPSASVKPLPPRTTAEEPAVSMSRAASDSRWELDHASVQVHQSSSDEDIARVVEPDPTEATTPTPPVPMGNSSQDAAVLLQFDAEPGVHFNPAPRYDLSTLHRCLHSTTAPGSQCVNGSESAAAFLVRCARACISWHGGNMCTGFVSFASTLCRLKAYFPAYRHGALDDTVSYRRSLSAAPSDFLRATFRSVSDKLYRRKLVFGVLSTAKYLTARLIPALNSWLCDVDAAILLEDNKPSRRMGAGLLQGRSVATSGGLWHRNRVSWNRTDGRILRVRPECLLGKALHYAKPPLDTKVLSYNGAWKNFPLLRILAKNYPLKDWVLVVDDDSFIVHRNLNLLLHSFYSRLYQPLAQAVMLGAIFRVGGTRNELFVQGGAGIVLSRVALSQLAVAVDPERTPSGVPSCFSWCQQWAGDIRMGCCAKLLKIPMLHDWTFWSEDVEVSILRARRPKFSYFPTSFHQMKDAMITLQLHDVLLRLSETGFSQNEEGGGVHNGQEAFGHKLQESPTPPLLLPPRTPPRPAQLVDVVRRPLWWHDVEDALRKTTNILPLPTSNATAEPL